MSFLLKEVLMSLSRTRSGWLLAFCLLVATPALAQHEHHSTVNEKTATLLPGLGNLRHPVTTKKRRGVRLSARRSSIHNWRWRIGALRSLSGQTTTSRK
jgi:hypothetical protein